MYTRPAVNMIFAREDLEYSSQYQLFEAGSITANQVKSLPADDPAVWRVICAPAKDTFVLC